MHTNVAHVPNAIIISKSFIFIFSISATALQKKKTRNMTMKKKVPSINLKESFAGLLCVYLYGW